MFESFYTCTAETVLLLYYRQRVLTVPADSKFVCEMGEKHEIIIVVRTVQYVL